MKSLHRRELAKFLGLTGAGLFIPWLRPGRAQAAAPPRRVIFFHSAQGMPYAPFRPKGVGGAAPTESAWALSDHYKMLEPFRDRLVLLSGVDFSSAPLGKSGNGHDQADQHNMSCFPCNGNNAGGPSIDQFIAQQLNRPQPVTLVPSLDAQVGLKDDSGKFSKVGSYVASGTRTPLETSLVKAYRRFFPGGPMDPGSAATAPTANEDAARAVAQRRQVLQFASSRYTQVSGTIKGKLGSQNVDMYDGLIRDLEKRLAGFTGPPAARSGSCALPLPGDTSKFSQRAEGFSKLIRAAFACDLTRVAFFHMGFPPGYLWNGSSFEGAHDQFHSVNQGETLSAGTLNLQRGIAVLADAFAQLCRLLDEVKEPDGSSLLDHTAILWSQELTTGNHGKENGKWILAGRLGGHYKTGRYIDKTADYNTRGNGGIKSAEVFTALAQGMGVKVAKYGDPRAGNGALTELSP